MPEGHEPVALSLGPRLGTVTFSSVVAVREWLHEEEKAWDWLKPIQNQDPAAGALRRRYSKAQSLLESTATAACEARGTDRFPVALESLRARFQESYGSDRILAFADARAKFVISLRQSDSDVVAACTAMAILRDHSHMGTPESYRGLIRALLFEHSLTEKVDAERAALDVLRVQWEEHVNIEKNNASEREKAFSDQVAQCKKLIEQKQGEFTNLKENAESDLSDLQNTYEEALTLAAPVDYWRKQGVLLGKRKWKYLVAAFAIGGLLLWGLVELVDALVRDVTTTPPFWKVGVILGTATLAFWIVRLLVKVYLSSQHLQTDAEERVVMMQSYLALIRSTDGLDEKSRILILNALFRPASTGIVKDDGAPIGGFDYLTRVQR